MPKMIDADKLEKVLLSEKYKNVTGSRVIHITDYELIREIQLAEEETKKQDPVLNTLQHLYDWYCDNHETVNLQSFYIKVSELSEQRKKELGEDNDE